MLEIFHELNQNQGIADARNDANRAQSSSQSAERKVEQLEKKLETSLMVCEALWNIVKKSHKLEDDDLTRMVKEIDRRDGRADGKVAKSAPLKCGACGKTIQRGKSRCMYCGRDHEISPFKR